MKPRPFLAIVNNTASNVGVHILPEILLSILLDICPKGESLKLILILFLSFLRTHCTITIRAAPCCIPANRVPGL